MTKAYNKFFINGEWVEPSDRSTLNVINPATEEAFATISMGTADDVDAAAKAARTAFPAWSQSTIEERKAVIGNIIAGMKARGDEIATAISNEMGAPMGLAKTAQLGSGMGALCKYSRHSGQLRIRRSTRQHKNRKRSSRRLRIYYPLELATKPNRLQGSSGDCSWLHDRIKAQRNSAIERLSPS